MRSILWLVLAVACSGKHTDPSHPSGSAMPPDGGAAAAAGPSERDCADQIEHAIALEITARKQAGAPLPTDDETAKLRTELHDRFLAVCRAGTLDGHRCAMAATDLASLRNCHATPSSSTSNKSVAPGGITPAAPRSP